MKQFKTIVVLVLLVAMLLSVAPGRVTAQTKFPSYVSGIQVQNLSSQPANVVLDYYHTENGTASGGTLAGSAPALIPGNQSATFVPAPAAPFSGSLVISSDQAVAAVSNIQNGAKTAMGSYVGRTSGATTINLPLLMKNNGSVPYDTWFSVQNAGSANATVTVTYSDAPGSPQTAVIKPGASKTFYQAQETFHTAKVFAATITSTQPIVAAVVQENVQKILAYTGFSPDGGSTSPVMPLVNMNNNGIVTGIQIQNTGGAATDVTLSYSPSSPALGTACTETQSIPAGSSKTFTLNAFTTGAPMTGITSNCTPGQKFVGTARVTANSANTNLVAIVNQNKASLGQSYSGAYGAFNPAQATSRVVLPLLMDRNGTSNRLGTAFSVMNVGSGSTFVRCTFTNLPTGVTYNASGPVAAGGSLIADQRGQIGTSYVGSGTCQAYSDAAFTTIDTTAKLVATVNEVSGIPANLARDVFMVYEGVSVAP